LKLTVLVPCVVPKFVPVIVTAVPTGPEVGERLVMLGGGGVTVKMAPLLETPPTDTTTLPLPIVAPVGTDITMLVPLQLVGDTSVPLKVTVLVPCVVPKFAPAMVTKVPTGPDHGERLVILGGGTTVKFTLLLATPATTTITFPVVAPVGTGVTMLVAVQLVGVATPPWNVTKLVPWVAPKLAPAIVTELPTGPELGDTLVMLGGGVTVNATPLLAMPPTVTTTFPGVAPGGIIAPMPVGPQLVNSVASVPLNVTVLVPCARPKFVPVIVTDDPGGPAVGFKLLIEGGVG